jgi:hypothetical protein
LPEQPSFTSAQREDRRPDQPSDLPDTRGAAERNQALRARKRKKTEDTLKVAMKILSLIAFLLGSPVYVQRRVEPSTPTHPLPVEAARATQVPAPPLD